MELLEVSMKLLLLSTKSKCRNFETERRAEEERVESVRILGPGSYELNLDFTFGEERASYGNQGRRFLRPTLALCFQTAEV